VPVTFRPFLLKPLVRHRIIREANIILKIEKAPPLMRGALKPVVLV